MNTMIISMIGLILTKILFSAVEFLNVGLDCNFQYYALFDNPATRGELAKLYNTEQVTPGGRIVEIS